MVVLEKCKVRHDTETVIIIELRDGLPVNYTDEKLKYVKFVKVFDSYNFVGLYTDSQMDLEIDRLRGIDFIIKEHYFKEDVSK